jgi:glycosyltransferase involved in cell wall biosynthesis
VRAIDFSRNFGKEIALCAGLDHTLGKAVVPIDVDLQDPPELIVDMVDQWRQGFDVVLAQRIDRSSDSWMKRTTAALFYRLLGGLSQVSIPPNVGDFRLLDARVVEAVRGYRERARFMKGIFASLGYKTCMIPYVRAQRSEGESKFRPFQLLRLAIEGIVSFTDVPLKIWTYIGGMASLGAVLYASFILLRTLIFGIDVPGYASLIIFVLLFNGLTLMGLGIQGEYIARIFSEVKARPLYLVRETIGMEPPQSWLDGESEDAGPA